MPKWLKTCICAVLILGISGTAAVFGIDAWVRGSVKDRILTEEKAAQLENVDCIVVLGCLVHSNGSPSDMLEDRLKRGVALYHLGAAPKLLMSGDHGTKEYDEVDAMKHYAVDAGIASADVFMDHAGFSTYETIYRAKEVFGADKIIIVTQEYHLYRAMYIARALGIEAYGVSADYRGYLGQTARDVREVLARVKDFGMTILKLITENGSGFCLGKKSLNYYA
jgi:vancomycin permeability regulator SanA